MKLKDGEYLLLKSKDDYSLEHYDSSPMSKMTGFKGTAGEAFVDKNGRMTLFVDPRYHIQAEIQTKNKNLKLVKMNSQYSLIDYFKNELKGAKILYVPDKSTNIMFYEKLSQNLDIQIKPYSTKNDTSSVDKPKNKIFSVNLDIAGEDVLEKLNKLKINNYLVVNLEHICWLLNLRSYKTSNTSTFRSKLYIKNSKKIYLFCDYKLPKIPDFIEVLPMRQYKKFISEINGVQIDSSISLYEYNLIKSPKMLSKSPFIDLVSIKNKNEINHYKDSFKRLDSALFEFRSKIKEGLSEEELNKIFETALKKEGGKCTSFKTILAIGDNSSIIHYTDHKKDKILKKEDVILLDCGGYYKGGYATDITRTFCLSPNEFEKEIYTAVLIAGLNVFHSNLRKTNELHNLAYNLLKKYEKNGFYFPHGLGHGIGIPVHQAPPTLSNKISQELKEGNIFSIEPGLYKEGSFGVRLENCVYFEKNEILNLSKFPYEENLINYDMLNKKEKEWLNNWQGQI